LALQISESDLFVQTNWTEPEWGFPKGRRNFKERDLECAIREFEEETGYDKKNLILIKNMNPCEEIFTGSNLKSYKHRYFLACMNYEDTLVDDNFQKSEIGSMKWFTYEEAIKRIRPYNLEKLELLKDIHGLMDKKIIF
jgi:8-oxo-dGTP pyrophosphatase MutT (NUDIX family)